MNITRTSRTPEHYSITDAPNVRVSAPWTPSGTRSGDCVEILGTQLVTVDSFDDETQTWTKIQVEREIRVPFARGRTRDYSVTRRVSKNDTSTYFDRLNKYRAIGNGESD